ncbi:MAG: hypothetical protein PUC00_09400 [Clostridiales bacterium]|nr:hypothetical protein [Clostridiales bacterium]
MLRELRMQLRPLLEAVPAQRKPALRRSDAPDALLATDLPLIASPDAVAAFRANVARLGWHTALRNGWLILDAPVPAPDAPIPASFTGECGCCISLLMRHKEAAPAQDVIRAIVKAAEAGPIPLERLCKQLHVEFAARLRQHAPLPGDALPYFCVAYRAIHKGGTP